MGPKRHLRFRLLRWSSALIIGFSVVFIWACGLVKEDARPVSVILISLDTLRADHLGCYGYDRATSPFFDELSREGVLFENAIVQVPGTLPSHMSMLTGLLPAEHAVFPPDGVLSEEIPLLPEILAAAGVRTAGFTEGGYVSGIFGFHRGFEVFDDNARKWNTDIEDVFANGLDFLNTLERDEPFFLFLHTYATHDPYYPPPPYFSAYLPDADASAAAGFERYPIDGLGPPDAEVRELQGRKHRAALDFISANLPPGAPMPTGPILSEMSRGRRDPPTDETLDVYMALYDATINYVDDVLRSLFFKLDQLDLRDDTVVIITSDHGEEFLEHGHLTHRQVYDECLRVPLLVLGPGVTAGRRIPELVMSIDLVPTVLEIMGVPAPVPVSGRSLAAALRPADPAVDSRDAHAVGIIDASEALYRRSDGEVLQAIARRLSEDGGGNWVERAFEIETFEDVLRFEIASYHRERTIEVTVDGHDAKQLVVRDAWQQVEIPLGEGGSKHSVQVRSATCDSPADVIGSADRRCLAFRLRNLSDHANQRTELYNLTRDPAAVDDLSGSSPELTRELLAGLEAFQREPVAGVSSSPLDDETTQRLRELGYIE